MANNSGDWQWIAGTGDTRPNRGSIRCAKPSDATRRATAYDATFPGLADVSTAHIHQPLRLAAPPDGYPPPRCSDRLVTRYRAAA
nr:hypothetical protein [Nonomuraea ceibae]